VVDISGLGQTDNGVNEDVGSSLSSSSDSELSVSSVHGVSGLESDNSPPRELVEVGSELSGGVYLSALYSLMKCGSLTSEGNVVEVVGSLDSLDLTTDVKLLGLVVEV
jgi:hypothetical protein